MDGSRDVLGMWFQEIEGAKFWMQVLVRRGAKESNGGARPSSSGRFSGWLEAEGSLIRETPRRVASGPDNDGASRYCQTAWARQARRKGVREKSACYGPSMHPARNLADLRWEAAQPGGRRIAAVSRCRLADSATQVCGGYPQSLSESGGCGAVRNRQLAQDPRYVDARGLIADEQLSADFAVGQAAGK